MTGREPIGMAGGAGGRTSTDCTSVRPRRRRRLCLSFGAFFLLLLSVMVLGFCRGIVKCPSEVGIVRARVKNGGRTRTKANLAPFYDDCHCV